MGEDGGGGLEATAGRFRFINRSGLDHIPPVSWLLPGAIPRQSYCILYGARGTFKTFLALDMALSVATGAAWPWEGLWGQVEESGPVLFAAGEGRSGLQQRVTAWEKQHWGGRQVSSNDFILADPVPKANEEWDAFISGAKAFSPMGYKLTIIDTLGRSMAGLNENNAQDAALFTERVETLQRELNTAVLAIAHSAKSGAGDSVRGSGGFEGDADIVLKAERANAKARLVTISMTKIKDGIEWDKPRVAKLAVVQLGEDESSLAVVAPSPEDLKASASGKKSSDDNDSIVHEILCEITCKLLAANKLKAWSGAELADTLALDERIEIGSSRLRNFYLKTLRESKESSVRHYYDGATRRWRWQD